MPRHNGKWDDLGHKISAEKKVLSGHTLINTTVNYFLNGETFNHVNYQKKLPVVASRWL